MHMAYTTNPNLPLVRMEAVILVESGWSIGKTAKHFGFSHPSVISWLKKKSVYGYHGKLAIPAES